MSFTVYVDDNFHYHKGERRCAGRYETAEDAIARCQAIVKESIERLRKPGMTPAELYEQYGFFGHDPWIEGVTFSAWDYAEQIAAEMSEAQ